MKFINSMAAEIFWVFGQNEGTNKKINNIINSVNIEMKVIIKVKE